MITKMILIEIEQFRTLSSLIDELKKLKETEGNLTITKQSIISLADYKEAKKLSLEKYNGTSTRK